MLNTYTYVMEIIINKLTHEISLTCTKPFVQYKSKMKKMQAEEIFNYSVAKQT